MSECYDNISDVIQYPDTVDEARDPSTAVASVDSSSQRRTHARYSTGSSGCHVSDGDDSNIRYSERKVATILQFFALLFNILQHPPRKLL